MPVSTTPNIVNTMQNDEKATSNKYVYQVWKGSNRFFLNGRLVFGPDVRSLVVTLFLIIVPAILFCVFVARHLLHKFPNNGGVAIMVMTVMYTICVLFLLLLTSGRDPGIVPRSRHPPEPEEDAEAASAEWGGSQTPRFRLPRTKDVIVNGVTVKTKYCDTCMLYRPPRCSHCSICNNCVERFDHHCPWVGQCIGKRNYRFFFMFVSSTTVLCIYVFAMSALYIKLLMNDGHYTVWRAMGKSPASVLLMAYTFIAVWFVGGLTFFHLYLIITNQTTYENFRYRYENKVNPYNLGTVSNFKEIFCSSIPPSKNRFRSRADEEVQSPPTPNLPPVGRTSPNVKHQTVEASKPPAWPIIGKDLISDEALEELHTRISNVGDIGLEPKDGLDTFAHAFNQLPFEATETTVASRSSCGSGNWEITTNTTVDSGDKVDIEVNRVPSNAPALPGEINAG